MINKCALRHLTFIGPKSTGIDKALNAGKNLAVLCVKFYGLADALRESEDDNDIAQTLREAHQFHKKIGCCHNAGHLRVNGVKSSK